jgi:hypothetical protein
MSPADVAAHKAASYVRTAPLPPAAAKALRSLERASIPMPLHVVRAVARYEAAALRYDELIARPASALSPAEVDAIGDAQQTMADEFGVLAEAGRTDLLGPLWVADRYRGASARCAYLAEYADFDGCLAAQDEMQMCLCQLERAGRLDLIGGAS